MTGDEGSRFIDRASPAPESSLGSLFTLSSADAESGKAHLSSRAPFPPVAGRVLSAPERTSLPLLCSLLKAAPKVPTTPVKAKRISTFQEFESNTSDAWDAGEDDDGLLAMAAESLNTDVVMETANRVLRNHSERQERHKRREAPGPEQKPKPSAEPPPVPSGDLRLVKSVSESHTSCPAGGAGARVGDVQSSWGEGLESCLTGWLEGFCPVCRGGSCL